MDRVQDQDHGNVEIQIIIIIVTLVHVPEIVVDTVPDLDLVIGIIPDHIEDECSLTINTTATIYQNTNLCYQYYNTNFFKEWREHHNLNDP